MVSSLAFLALVVSLAGLIRGVTGFGGAMLMAPVLSLLLGPIESVVITLALETLAALGIISDARGRIRWRLLGLIAIPACLTVPLGAQFLVSVDPAIARRAISAVVVVFSLVMLAGFRYSGAPRPLTSAAVGGLSGLLLGATSVGGPPVILYLLSGPDRSDVTRVNLTVFVTITSLVGLAAVLLSGNAHEDVGGLVAGLAVPYLAGVWVGGHLFARLNDALVRRLALALMLAGGLFGLAA